MAYSERRTDPWWEDCLFSAGRRVAQQRPEIETITPSVLLFMFVNGTNRIHFQSDWSGFLVSFLLIFFCCRLWHLSVVDYFSTPAIMKRIWTFYGLWIKLWCVSECGNPSTSANFLAFAKPQMSFSQLYAPTSFPGFFFLLWLMLNVFSPQVTSISCWSCSGERPFKGIVQLYMLMLLIVNKG